MGSHDSDEEEVKSALSIGSESSKENEVTTVSSEVKAPLTEEEKFRKKFPKAAKLSSLRSTLARHCKKHAAPFKGGTFPSISAVEVDIAQQVFIVLFEMYEQKPFLELIENQETLESVAAEITFGISDDAFRVDVTVADSDRWLIPQNEVGVSFSGGFCYLSLNPVEKQFGEADVFVEVEDVGGVSKHDFTIKVVENKQARLLEAQQARKGLVSFGKPRHKGSNLRHRPSQETAPRSENPARWTTAQVCDFLLEVGLSKYARGFAAKDTNGAMLLALTTDDLRDDFSVKKPRDRSKFGSLLEKLNEQSVIAAHAEEEKKQEDAKREKLRKEKEIRRAMARAGHVHSANQGSASPEKVEGIDPWLCGMPSVKAGTCRPTCCLLVGITRGPKSRGYENRDFDC